MKRTALSTLSLALLGTACAAQAQNTVTLYGVIDNSIQYVHNANQANDNLWQLAGGNLQGPRWGMKGKEDLGGGLKAVFQLESGFDPNSGRMNQGGRLFGRQAYVGLAHDQFGTVTLGRQYDPVVDMVQGLTADGYWGSTFTTPGDVDNNDNSSRTNNAVKYVSPVFSGVQLEGMYALGGVAGSIGAGQTWSGAAAYGFGPFNAAAGYIRMDNGNTAAGRGVSATNPTASWGSGATSDGTFDSQINGAYASAKSISIASAAGQYVTGSFTFNIRYSFAQYKPDGLSAFTQEEKYQVVGGCVGYQVTPAMLLGLGYTYTHGSGDTSASYNQVSLGGDYSLSKRIDVYLVGAYQHANGTQRVNAATTQVAGASVGSYGNNAGSASQAIVSVGMRQKF
jgi:predicted porin